MSTIFIFAFARSLMTTLSFNSVPSDPFSNIGGLNPEITRIKTLIETIENYGVDRKFLFSVEDLYEKKHVPKVVRCLQEIEKLVKMLSMLLWHYLQFVAFFNKLHISLFSSAFPYSFQARQEAHVNFASLPVNRVYYWNDGKSTKNHLHVLNNLLK